ncbi:MAG: MarR family transcriptional regulator [Oricola sp.]
MNEKQVAKSHTAMWDNPRFRNWVAVARACHLVQQELGRRLRPLDLKTPHLDILVNLVRTAGISQQDLARKLFVGRSNMTMLLPQLEKRGLVERQPDASDKRVLRLYLTGKGRALADEAIAIQAAIVDDIMSVTSPEECELVGDSMRRVVARLLEIQSTADESEGSPT